MEIKGEHGNAVVYVIVGVVIIALGVVGYKMLSHTQSVNSIISPTVTSQPISSSTPMSSPSSSSSGGLTNKTDTSNAQLDKDLQQIGNSMGKLDKDSSTVNQDPNKAAADNPNQ